MAYAPNTFATNCVDPKALKFFVLLASTIKLNAEVEQYRGVKANGQYPSAPTERTMGVVYMTNNGYATLVTEGEYIVQVQPGQAIALDAKVAIGPNGLARTAGETDEVLGYSRDVADATGTAQRPYYVRVKIG